jgi:ABC-type nitrate/sulfonate/bicarbonate transport system permease component
VTLAFPARAAAAFARRLRPFALLSVLVAAWELICTLWLPSFDPQIAILLPSPSTLVVTAGKMIASGELLHHLAASLRRETVAFLLALVAVPLGIAMGWWRGAHEQLYPVFEILRPIPPLAWIPLSILWFGLGDIQNQFIIFLGMVFPILLNTVSGVSQVDRNLVRAARSLGAGEAALLRRVVLKAALPQIVIGLRVGLGFGWMALVAAELVGANSGLGFLINDARSLLRTDIVVVGMLAIGITGLIIDFGLRRLAGLLLPWSRDLRG